MEHYCRNCNSNAQYKIITKPSTYFIENKLVSCMIIKTYCIQCSQEMIIPKYIEINNQRALEKLYNK